jgi:hypothetical protein
MNNQIALDSPDDPMTVDLSFRRSDELHCCWESLHYDPITRRGILHLPAMNSCDGRGCIALFERIDPEVKQIQVYAGGGLDIRYVKRGDKWASGMGRGEE